MFVLIRVATVVSDWTCTVRCCIFYCREGGELANCLFFFAFFVVGIILVYVIPSLS